MQQKPASYLVKQTQRTSEATQQHI